MNYHGSKLLESFAHSINIRLDQVNNYLCIDLNTYSS